VAELVCIVTTLAFVYSHYNCHNSLNLNFNHKPNPDPTLTLTMSLSEVITWDTKVKVYPAEIKRHGCGTAGDVSHERSNS